MTEPRPSADRLREMLAAHGSAMRAYMGEALYHAQVDYTCQLLDVVDEVASPATAKRITGAICARLVDAGALAAAERMQQRAAEIEVLERRNR